MAAQNMFNASQQEADRYLHCLKLMAFIFWGANGKDNWAHLLQQAQDLWTEPGSAPAFSSASFARCLNEQLACGSPQDINQGLEEAYVSLFINARQGIAAPLYQSCFEEENPRLNSAPAQRMLARLQQVDLSLDHKLRQPPDHLSIQLEYLYFLLSWALQERDQKLLKQAIEFAVLEMLPWVKKLELSIVHARGHIFFQEAIQELARMIAFLQR